MTRIEVTECNRECPFMRSGGGEYAGDYPFAAWCEHPVAPASPGQHLDTDAARIGLPMPPPEWCPLRQGDALVTLKLSEAHK